jgi:uncharacterized protein (DUF1800 family)
MNAKDHEFGLWRAISLYRYPFCAGLPDLSFSPELADIRFGCGLSPVLTPIQSRQAMLDGVSGADEMAKQFAIEPFWQFRSRLVQAQSIRKDMRRTRGTDAFAAHKTQLVALARIARRDMALWHGQTMLRWINTDHGFRERLTVFWGDHFTTKGKSRLLRSATSPFIEAAIRPHLAGSFTDLLIASVTHPLMLHFLDQDKSVGPNSRHAKRKYRQKLGLNENLAREVLELHTLGVNGPYSQTDVRQLAELFTGMTSHVQVGFKFRKDHAEPGPETVLGKTYGRGKANRESVIEVLSDLAAHPATARHIAWKLAVHFVSDVPDTQLVDHIAERYRQTDGDLLAVYTAMLEHPAAWEKTLLNVKPPADFVGSALRAISVRTVAITKLNAKEINANLRAPMTLMGQTWQKPRGPDGWPEQDAAWVTPQGVSARLRWAMSVPQILRPDLPDPRGFVVAALGSQATESVKFVATSAESRADAIGLVLASPAFQRR